MGPLRPSRFDICDNHLHHIRSHVGPLEPFGRRGGEGASAHPLLGVMLWPLIFMDKILASLVC